MPLSFPFYYKAQPQIAHFSSLNHQTPSASLKRTIDIESGEEDGGDTENSFVLRRPNIFLDHQRKQRRSTDTQLVELQ